MAGSPLLSLFSTLLFILCLFDQIKALPTNDADAPFEASELRDMPEGELLKRQNIATYYTYSVDANLATQNSLVQSKQAAGYRIVSISVYGDPTNPLFSTVWSNRPVQGGIPPYVVVQTNVVSSFDDAVGNYIASGYTASLISASGPHGQTQFVCVLEKLSTPLQSMVRIEMDGGDGTDLNSIEAFAEEGFGQKMKMKSIAIYGGPSNRIWGAVFVQNTALTKYLWTQEIFPSYYPTELASYNAMPGFRPAWVSFDVDMHYALLSTNERMPTSVPWQHQYGLTKTALISAINTAASSGLAPIMITGGGSTTNTGLAYAVIFGTSDVPAPRVMSAPSGTANTSFIANSQTVVPAIHNAIQSFMLKYAVRYAQISIKAGGDRRFDFAYAYTEPNNCSPFRCTINPGDKLQLGSNSKIFLSAAISLEISRGSINLNTPIFQVLGYSASGPANKRPIDPRYLAITVGQCVDHTAGWDTTLYDPTYKMREIAIFQHNDGKPATTMDIIDYMVTQKKLDYPPGQPPNPNNVPNPYIYSNFGYLVLSALASQTASLSYWNLLNYDIFPANNVNMSQIAPVQTSPTNRPAGEIVQESRFEGYSALAPANNDLVPFIYGGDDNIKEVDTGTNDITCSMDLLSGFIHKNAVWGLGGRADGYYREGSDLGAWTRAESLSAGGDIDYAIAFNTRDWLYPQYTDPDDDAANATPEVFVNTTLYQIIDSTDWGVR